MTAPLSIGDMANAFEVTYTDIGNCIKEGLINKWAKYKPIERNQVTPLTDAQRKAENHGFLVTQGTNSIYDYSIPGLFDRYAAVSGDYKYVRPTTWYRLTDLVPYNSSSSTPFAGNGYSKNAPPPFVYNNPTRGTGTVTNYTLSVTISSAADAEISIADIVENNPAGAYLSSMYIALAVKYTKGSTTYYKLARAHTLAATPVNKTLATFVPGESLQAEIELDGFRDYTMMWCATAVDPSDPSGAGASVFLPLGGFTYTYSQASVTITYTYSWSNSPTGVKVYDSDLAKYVAAINFTNSYGRVTMGSAAPESRTATIYCTPFVYTRGGETIVCDEFSACTAGAVSANVTTQQTIDVPSYLGGSKKITVGGEYIPVSEIDYVDLVTQVNLDSGGSVVIVLSGTPDHTTISSFS